MYSYTPILNEEDLDAALREIEDALDPGVIFNPALLNSWVNYGSPYGNAGFRKDGQGIVHLEGVIKDGTNDLAAFTLPIFHRPATDVIITTVSNKNHAAIIIQADGDVVPTGTGSILALSLDGLYFRTKQ